MSDCCDLKCEREFSKINDSHFQHLWVIKIAKSSSNLAIYFRMRFQILVHCDKVGKIVINILAPWHGMFHMSAEIILPILLLIVPDFFHIEGHLGHYLAFHGKQKGSNRLLLYMVNYSTISLNFFSIHNSPSCRHTQTLWLASWEKLLRISLPCCSCPWIPAQSWRQAKRGTRYPQQKLFLQSWIPQELKCLSHFWFGYQISKLH